MRYALKAASLQSPVLTNRNDIGGRYIRVSNHILVTPQIKREYIGRCRRDWMKEKALTGGGLALHELFREKSAEAILVGEMSRPGERKSGEGGDSSQ